MLYRNLCLAAVLLIHHSCSCCYRCCCPVPPLPPLQMVYDALVTAEILPSSDSSSSTQPPLTNGNGKHHIPTTNGNGKSHQHDSDGSADGSNGEQQQQHQEVAVSVKSGPAWAPSDPDCPAWSALWSSICEVWASKWNHRAWLSRQSAGLPEEQLAVSVLIQQVSG